MSKFNNGDKVLYTPTQERGFIIQVYLPRRGHQLYRVKFDSRIEDVDSSDLLPDADLSDPFERCRENIFDYYTEYLKENTAFKIQSSNNSTISSLKASRTLFRPYQFKPLLKFLNSDNRRILIADEVGLGKTIEAGHIMLELKARDELYNALVLCPKSLVVKWTTELNEKFGLNFISIENKSDLLHEMQYHNGNVRAVVNYDKIRKGSDILKYILEKNIKFSLVVCDESHRLRNNNTLIYNGLSQFTVLCDSMVFMSATPIMIDESNLYNQLHLLDENLYDNREVFMNNLRLNKPFLTALSQLKNEKYALKDIFDELAETRVTTYNIINDVELPQEYTIGEYFQDYPIFHQIAEEMTSGADSLALRAKIQYNLSEMNPMNVIFSRTRKREVTQDWTQAKTPKTPSGGHPTSIRTTTNPARKSRGQNSNRSLKKSFPTNACTLWTASAVRTRTPVWQCASLWKWHGKPILSAICSSSPLPRKRQHLSRTSSSITPPRPKWKITKS